MADSLDSSGLTVKTLPEIITELTTGLQNIYGIDINLNSNSPDGQMLNIFAQACEDLRELIVQVNNGFNPDLATGRILDQRVVINNIERKGGTFTTIAINVVTDRTVTLQGLDDAFNDIDGIGYTVQDEAGNQFILADTTTVTAGTTSLNFRAKQIGKVETTVGTITNPTTIVLGVISVNNPSGALEVGQNEETDSELRIRRQKSVAISSLGYLNGILGAVLALDGVTDAKVYENVTDSTDVNGIPAHGIWVIAEGGANTDIADVIYNKKSFGANMKGAEEVDIATASGGIFTAKFDRPEAKSLYMRFDIQPTFSGASFDSAAIKAYIVANLTYDIGDYAETSAITAIALAAINATGGKGVPVNMEVSKNGSAWFDYLPVDTLDEQWTVDASRITITVL